MIYNISKITSNNEQESPDMFADKSSDTSSSNATPAGNKPWNWSNGVTEDSIRETKRELVSFLETL